MAAFLCVDEIASTQTINGYCLNVVIGANWIASDEVDLETVRDAKSAIDLVVRILMDLSTTLRRSLGLPPPTFGGSVAPVTMLEPLEFEQVEPMEPLERKLAIESCESRFAAIVLEMDEE